MSATEPAAVPEVKRSPRRMISVVVKLAIAAGLLGYVFWRVDLHAVSRIMATADPVLLAVAAVLSGLVFPLGGIRWWCVIRGGGTVVSLRTLIGLFWIGGFVSQILPNPLGDAVRISIAVRRGIPLSISVFSAIYERVAMIVVLLVLIAATAPLLDLRLGTTAPLWIALAMLAVGAGGIALLMVADRFVRRFGRLRRLAALSSGFRGLVLSRWLPRVMAVSVLAHFDGIVVAAIIGRALHLPLGPLDYLVVMPVATLAMVLPISIGGWGVREGVLVAVLGAMAVPAQNALAFSVTLGLVLFAASLPALPIWLVSGRSRPRPD